MNFRVGQKVVRIEGGTFDLYPDERGPSEGEVVTIRHIEFCHDGVGLAFEEYRNPHHYPDQKFPEAVFLAWRFRPVVEKKTDISIFTEMLKPKQRETADVH